MWAGIDRTMSSIIKLDTEAFSFMSENQSSSAENLEKFDEGGNLMSNVL